MAQVIDFPKPATLEGLRKAVAIRLDSLQLKLNPRLVLNATPTEEKPCFQVLIPTVIGGEGRVKPGGKQQLLPTFQVLILQAVKAGSNDDPFAALEGLLQQVIDLIMTRRNDAFNRYESYTRFSDYNIQILNGTHLLATVSFNTGLYMTISESADA